MFDVREIRFYLNLMFFVKIFKYLSVIFVEKFLKECSKINIFFLEVIC